MKTKQRPPLRLAKVWDGEHASCIQRKYDGVRLAIYKGADGVATAFGRDQREHLEYFSRFPTLRYRLQSVITTMTDGSIVDGELFAPGRPASDVSSLLASGDVNALEYMIFAVPRWCGNDWSDAHPVDLYNLFDGRLPMVKTALIEDDDLHLEALNARIESSGIEGFILKNHNYGEWWKVKPTRTVDGVITGYKMGKGRLSGLIGALLVSVYRGGDLVEIASVSGMTDADRRAMTEDSDLLGKVCEVKYQCVAAKGRLRHPRFVRLRDDKPAAECTFAA